MRRAVVVAVMLWGRAAWASPDPCPSERGALNQSAQRSRNPFDTGARNAYDSARSALSSCEQAAKARDRELAKAKRKADREAAEAERIEKGNREAAERAERERTDAAEAARAQAEEDAATAAIKADKKKMSAIFGAGFCLLRSTRRNALQEIATQRKYSRIGGVQNNVALMQLQNILRKVDELEAKDRADLKGFRGVAPMSCKVPIVIALMFCQTTEDRPLPEGCSNPTMVRMTALVTNPNGSDDDE